MSDSDPRPSLQRGNRPESGLGALSSSLAAGVAGEVTTAPMARLPLLLIPAFLVPLLLMLHLAALFQARRLASSGRSGARA